MAPADESWYQRAPGHRHRIGAGGAVVRRTEAGLLLALIKEVEIGDKYYVLPKGGVELGEDLEQAARREIVEETGLGDLTHLGSLGTLARQNVKKTYWQTSHYGLYVTRQAEGGPTDPDNYGLAWFLLDDLPLMFWPDERQLIAARREWIRHRVGIE
jgi:8-oxo-dGTP pyrophosphatase MutT (NUDIX family)